MNAEKRTNPQFCCSAIEQRLKEHARLPAINFAGRTSHVSGVSFECLSNGSEAIAGGNHNRKRRAMHAGAWYQQDFPEIGHAAGGCQKLQLHLGDLLIRLTVR